MADIKTREKVKGTIKALDRSAAIVQQMKKAYIQSKGKAERNTYSSDSTPDEYAADQITDAAGDIAHESVYHTDKLIHAGVNGARKAANKRRNYAEPVSASDSEPHSADLPATLSVDSGSVPVETGFPKTVREPSVHSVTQVERIVSHRTHGGTTATVPNPAEKMTPAPNEHLQATSIHPTVNQNPNSIPLSKSLPISESENIRIGNVRSPRTIKTLERNGESIKQTAWSTGKVAVKPSREPVKIIQKTIPTPQATTKSFQASVKSAHSAAQASTKASRTAFQTIRSAGHTAVTSTKAVANTTVKAVKSAIAETQALISTLAAGGSVALIVILLIVMVGLIAGSSYGIFFSGEETGTGMTIRNAVQEINHEYQERLNQIEINIPHDNLETVGTRAVWPEVLAVYAVKVNTDPDSPMEVTSMNMEKQAFLKEIFWAMNEISYQVETHEDIEITETVDENGSIIVTESTVTNSTLYITISHKTPEEMAVEYQFSQEQREMLAQLLDGENARLWSGVLYGIHSGDSDIVAVAATQLGNVGGAPYWSWYGFSSRVEWCACFVSWCANECGYIDAGIVPKFAGCVLGAQWFKDRGQWADGDYEPQPGTIIFFDWDDGGQDGRSDHVGIVEKVESGIVYTIEGNSNNACRRRSYPVGWYEIYGYGMLGNL